MKLGYFIAGAAVSLMLAGGAFAADIKHFHPKGKPPSTYTVEIIKKARATMPFSDKRDFDEQKKGFIAAPDSMKIKADAGTWLGISSAINSWRRVKTSTASTPRFNV